MANIITDYCISPDGFMQILKNIEINSGKYEIFKQCRPRGAGLRKTVLRFTQRVYQKVALPSLS